jgi:putative ABC transport system substrate-binding protein
MRRREFVALAAAALAAPRVARPQATLQPLQKTIGVLSMAPPPTPKQIAGYPGNQVLRKLGWVEGKNLSYLRRFANFDARLLPGYARELVEQRVDVIRAFGPEAALAAARATRNIPIAFTGLPWPLEQGLIESFARPGRNATGISVYAGVEVTLKRLEFLRAIVPAAKRLAWMWPYHWAERLGGGHHPFEQEFEAAARGQGFEPRFYAMRATKDLDAALADMAAWHVQAIMGGDPYSTRDASKVAAFALRERVPTAYPALSAVEAGALFSYAQRIAELIAMIGRLAEIEDRLLRGEDAAAIPVERPSEYELTVNLKTAKALGLSIPQSILLRVHRVIE